MILSWMVVGRFAPNLVAVGWAVGTFFLILRTRDLTKVLLAFIMMLILSDSRVAMMSFAATAKIGAVLLLVAFVFRNFDEFRALDNRIFRYFFPFLAFAILASMWSISPFTSFQKSLSYSLVFFTVPVFFLGALRQNERLGVALVHFLTVVLGIGLFAYIISPDFATLVGRYRGLLGNPNGMGILLTVSGPLYFLIRRNYKDRFTDKYSEGAFILFYVASLLLTGSRTSLFAVLLFLFFVRLRYLSNAVTLVVFLVIVSGYDFILTSLPQVAQMLGFQEYLRIETLDEGSGRFIAWNFAWTQIQDVFFAGGGYGYTEIIYKKFFWELSALGHQGNAHNSYLTLWLDTGLIGIILFATAIIRTVLICTKESTYALPVIYSVLFSANFESWLAASLNPFTSLFLISLTLLSQPEQVQQVIESEAAKDDTESPALAT